MKKVFFFFFFFFFLTGVDASNVYISKKDIDTGEFVNDCDFLLVDFNNNIIDRWVQDDNYHALSLDNGYYRIITRPYIMGAFSDDMSESHFLNVTGDVNVSFYNSKIDTPDNLSVNFNKVFSLIFIIGGFLIIFLYKFF